MAQGAVAARRPTVIRQATIAAALVMLGTLTGTLAGCGKPAPDPTPTSSSTTPSPTATETGPTPSPTPSPTPPAKPAAWTTNDDTGALAAAQYFMDLFAYTNATGDVSTWQAVSTPDCEFCSGTATDVTAIYGAGGHIEGAQFALSDAEVVGYSATLNVRTVQFRYEAQAGRAVDARGASTKTYEAEVGYLLLDLGYTGEGWLLVGGHAKSEPVRK